MAGTCCPPRDGAPHARDPRSTRCDVAAARPSRHVAGRGIRAPGSLAGEGACRRGDGDWPEATGEGGDLPVPLRRPEPVRNLRYEAGRAGRHPRANEPDRLPNAGVADQRTPPEAGRNLRPLLRHPLDDARFQRPQRRWPLHPDGQTLADPRRWRIQCHSAGLAVDRLGGGAPRAPALTGRSSRSAGVCGRAQPARPAAGEWTVCPSGRIRRLAGIVGQSAHHTDRPQGQRRQPLLA